MRDNRVIGSRHNVYDDKCKGNKMSTNKKPAFSALSQVTKTLTNTAPAVGGLKLSDTSKTLLGSFSVASKDFENQKAFLADSLFSDGIRAFHMVGKTDEDKNLLALRGQIIDLLLNNTEDFRVYHAESKTLSLVLQGAQVQMRTVVIPNLLKNIKTALKGREAKVKNGGVKSKASTKAQMVLKSVKQAIRYIGECKEGYTGMVHDLETLNRLAVLTQVK